MAARACGEQALYPRLSECQRRGCPEPGTTGLRSSAKQQPVELTAKLAKFHALREAQVDGTRAGKTTLQAAKLAYEYNDYPSPPGTTGQPQRGGANLDYGAQDGRVFGPGVCVPMYVVSPWSRGGWVNSQALDHTSVIRFLEARFGVKEPNISPFRRAVLGDLTSSFNFANPDHEALPALAGRKTKGEADALRAAQQALPQRVARSRAGSRRRHGVGAPAQRPQHAIAVLEPTGWWYAT